MVTITETEENSYAARAGIRAGDVLVSLNGHAVRDVLDYRFYLAERTLFVSCLREGKELSFTIEQGEYEDIGLSFETPLMDKKKTCHNKCIFCFIDQMPKGYRETLYFKDDDSRLSFLQGNYVTLTNMTEEDIDRIIEMRMSPLHVSVHTTNPDLRVKMMRNKRAGEVLAYLPRLAEAGITLRGQIVLCRGFNDGEELCRSLRDLMKLVPALDSLSVVPAGLTCHREGLYPLTPFTSEECRTVVETVEAFAAECYHRHGQYVFAASDEWYLKAGLPLPDEEKYEDYPQLENGVGMLTSFEREFAFALDGITEEEKAVCRRVTVATGKAAAPLLSDLAERLCALCTGLSVEVVTVENEFFGSEITVAGLLTGEDYLSALSGRSLGEAVLISRTSLRAEGDLFLCGMAKEELEKKLSTPVLTVENDGYAYFEALLGLTEEE